MHETRYRLPPLDFLRGFEAAARTLSFTKAAEELFLTQSAVSRQIKGLEEQIGCALFTRKIRSLALTDEGVILQRAVTETLDRLQDAVDQLGRIRRTRQVTVTCTSGFASLWLIPRLPSFTARHPDVEVRITVSTALADLQRDRIDIAIRFCPPDMVPPGTPRLFGEETVPVCSPRLLEDPGRPLRAPEDLVHHVLLHYEVRGFKGSFLDWETWLTALGLGNLRPAGMLTFNQSDQPIQAALAGQGIALGQQHLVQGLIREGRLATPFGPGVAGKRAFFVVTAPPANGRKESPEHVRAFSAWLLSEAATGGA